MGSLNRAALKLALVGAAVAACAGPVQAAAWDEALQGELSGNRLAPSLMVLEGGLPAPNGESGFNIVSGHVGSGLGGEVERDYLSIVVPEGFELAELRVGQQTQFGGNGSFLGIAAGAVMPVAADAVTAVGLLGWRIVGAADRGTSILDEMGSAGNGASGFVGALPSGTYTVWAQELASGSFAYRYNFVLSPVPEPLPLLLLPIGMLVLRRAAPDNKDPRATCVDRRAPPSIRFELFVHHTSRQGVTSC